MAAGTGEGERGGGKREDRIGCVAPIRLRAGETVGRSWVGRCTGSCLVRRGGESLEGPGSESLDPQKSSIRLAPPPAAPPEAVVVVGVVFLNSSSTSLRIRSSLCRGFAAEMVVGGVR